MSRSRKKKSSSVIGAVVVEVFAIAIFAFLVVQARAERQQSTDDGKPTEMFVFQELFSQMPFTDVLAQTKPTQSQWSATSSFGR